MVERASIVSLRPGFRRRLRCVRDRQGETKSGAASGKSLGPDPAIVQPNDGAADGEPEAAAASRAVMELREYALDLVVVEPDAEILDRYDDLAVQRARADSYQSAGLRVAGGIFHQVRKRLVD